MAGLTSVVSDPIAGAGFTFGRYEVYGTASGASFSRGDVVQFVMDSSGNYSAFTAPGSPYGTSHAVFGVCLEDITSGARGRVCIVGTVEAYTYASSGTPSVAVGGAGVPDTNKNIEFLWTSTYNAKVVASICAAVATMSSTRTLRLVHFNGFSGWGGRSGGAG